MLLIWNIERVLLELIRFNNCIILFPLQVVRRSRIGIHISNSMSLHFLVECSVSNSCCALLTLRFNLILQWLVIFSPSLLAFATVDLHRSASTRFPVPNSPPSILPLQYPRPYECTMELGCDYFFCRGHDQTWTGRVSHGRKKIKKKSRGRVTSLSDHACIIVTVSRDLFIYNSPSETIYFVWPV